MEDLRHLKTLLRRDRKEAEAREAKARADSEAKDRMDAESSEAKASEAKEEQKEVSEEKATEVSEAPQGLVDFDESLGDPPVAELTEEEQGAWFRRDHVPDVSPFVLGNCLANLSLPTKDEAFEEVGARVVSDGNALRSPSTGVKRRTHTST